MVVSPLRRTTETAIGALGKWLHAQPAAGRPPVVLQSSLQETAEVLCDTGSRIPRLKSWLDEESAGWLDFSALSPSWYVKEGINEERHLKDRLQVFEEWLAGRPEKVVIVVAHHNVFLGLLGVSFKNCECREYLFRPNTAEWVAQTPGVSSCDSQLSEADEKHLANYEDSCRENLAKWGLPVPARLR